MSTSYPSAILCRDKALLVNLEHIKCIITSQYVLVLNADQVGLLAVSKISCHHASLVKGVRLTAHHRLEHWEFTAGHWPAGQGDGAAEAAGMPWDALRCHEEGVMLTDAG